MDLGSAEKRTLLRVVAQANRCTGCGACDRIFEAYERVDRTMFRGPSQLPLSILHEPTSIAEAYAWLISLGTTDIKELERLCPGKVPLEELRLAVQKLAPAPATPVALGSKKHDPG